MSDAWHLSDDKRDAAIPLILPYFFWHLPTDNELTPEWQGIKVSVLVPFLDPKVVPKRDPFLGSQNRPILS